MKCRKCGNELVLMPVKKKVHLGMGRYATRPDGHRVICTYCEWKGNTGPGKELRETIQKL